LKVNRGRLRFYSHGVPRKNMKSSLVSTIILSAIGITASAQPPKHAFSVKDDIAMVRFSDPSPEQSDPTNDGAKVSPDGRYAAIVTTRGLLDSDQIESTVSTFDLDAIDSFLREPSRQPPKPHIVATIVARPNSEQTIPYAPVIKDLRWSPDGKRLCFRGQSSNGGMQLYEVNADGSGLHALTPISESVDRFDLTKDTIVYTAAKMGQPPPPQGTNINRDALAVTGYRLMNILFPGQMASYDPQTFTMASLHTDGPSEATQPVPRYAVPDTSLLLHFFPFRLSPDGRQLVTIMPVRDVPDSWKNYEPAPAFEHRRFDSKDAGLTSPDNMLRPRQYALVDLATGNTIPVVNAPSAQTLGYYADKNISAWAPDGSRVLITNLFLPLHPRADRDSSSRTHPCAVASVDLPSLKAACLFFEDPAPASDVAHVEDVSFGRGPDEVLVSSTQHTLKTFRFRDGAWKLISSDPVAETSTDTGDSQKTSRQLHVFIRQGLNVPPTLWASEPQAGAARQLWDPNPELQQVAFGEASVYHWTDRTGTEWTGGLVKPVGYLPGKRYPLVIQMYLFRENEFMTDGTDPSAFAARPLASAGFMVLQIRKKPSVLSEADPQTHLEAYRSAIESLSDAGLADPGKVGVVGFSWTCWYVINALIKAPGLFAAATIADGLDNSYMQYVLFGPGPASTHEQMDRIRGGGPFGPGLKNWIEEAPGFHLDQVHAPVRIEAINPTSVLQEWELYAGLYMQHKPVDLIYFPEGTHIHQRPLERLESQQGNVDWLRFWLQGYEDPDPAKRSQYQRWQEMKENLRTQQASTARQ
jgi:dipeptidyl aminopeptidase/acylaminoacyl peptidase